MPSVYLFMWRCSRPRGVSYHRFQVACPMHVKWKIKLTNQNRRTRWRWFWLVSLMSRFYVHGTCNLKSTVPALPLCLARSDIAHVRIFVTGCWPQPRGIIRLKEGMSSVQCSMHLKKVYPQCSAVVSVRKFVLCLLRRGFSTLVPSIISLFTLH